MFSAPFHDALENVMKESRSVSEAYLGPPETCKMESFSTIVYGF